MDTLSNLILQIYRAARETPVDEYQDFVLGLVRSLVPFTSSRWATLELVGKKAIAHSTHLQNEPTNIILDWGSINHKDRAILPVSSNPGKAFSIHTPTIYAGPEYAEMRDYTERYKHANSLVISIKAAEPRHLHALSLFRADPDAQFNAVNQKLLEQLMPHMVEALAQNLLLSFHQVGTDKAASEQVHGAIAGHDGKLYYAGSGFNHLIQKEWPDWKGNKLPEEVLHARASKGGTGFTGQSISISVSIIGHLIFLRASLCNRLWKLSHRESAIAQLYGEGHSYKEIAKQLEIAPTTVRNVIQRIYAKLEITDKAELAVMVNRS